MTEIITFVKTKGQLRYLNLCKIGLWISIALNEFDGTMVKKMFEAVESNSSLVELVLSVCNFAGQEHAKQIANAIKMNNSLQRIYLSNTILDIKL